MSGHREIAIGDDADDAILDVEHRHRAAVVLPHDLGGGGQAIARSAGAHIARHDVLDFHGADSLISELPLETPPGPLRGSEPTIVGTQQKPLRRGGTFGAILLGLDFHAYAEQPDDELDLLEGALLIAKDAYPGLEPAEIEAQLDALAEPLIQASVSSMPAPVQARALAEHLFVRAGFPGKPATTTTIRKTPS